MTPTPSAFSRSTFLTTFLTTMAACPALPATDPGCRFRSTRSSMGTISADRGYPFRVARPSPSNPTTASTSSAEGAEASLGSAMEHPDLLLAGAGCVKGAPAAPESTMLPPSPPRESGVPASPVSFPCPPAAPFAPAAPLLVPSPVPDGDKPIPVLSVRVVPLKSPARLSGQQ